MNTADMPGESAETEMTCIRTRSTRILDNNVRSEINHYDFGDGEQWDEVHEWARNTRGEWRAGRTLYFRNNVKSNSRAFYKKTADVDIIDSKEGTP